MKYAIREKTSLAQGRLDWMTAQDLINELKCSGAACWGTRKERLVFVSQNAAHAVAKLFNSNGPYVVVIRIPE